MVEFVQREIAILQKISHPNIVRLYDVARTNNYLYMFLEYCADGDLKEYMTKKEEKRLREVILISYFSLKQSFSLNILLKV
jgi:serine/threonine-protein kinase ULK/ATG1